MEGGVKLADTNRRGKSNLGVSAGNSYYRLKDLRITFKRIYNNTEIG
ncbi:MAG: hypothetical protein IPQ05_06360 [Leptospiraceae bacterium]|nr:hypothetical protein [Leptospiraceae bacterium]